MGLPAALVLSVIISFDKWDAYRRMKMIGYNILFHSAVDFTGGNKYHLVAHSGFSENRLLKNLNLKSARILSSASTESEKKDLVFLQNNFYHFCYKGILIIETSISDQPTSKKVRADYLIISKKIKNQNRRFGMII